MSAKAVRTKTIILLLNAASILLCSSNCVLGMEITMIRLIFAVLFLIIYCIFSLILIPLEWLIGKFNKRAKDISSLRLIQWFFKGILFISGVKTTVIGYENIPKNEPVLFIGNHRGIFDILITYSRMPGLTGYIAKKEVKKLPIISTWMKMLYCLFLDRDNVKEGLKTILTGIEHIKNGVSIVIFPEGTRNKGEGLLPFHAGSFKLADKTNCKIIPMVQTNTEAILENHFPKIKAAHTTLEFGRPIDITSFSKEERRNIADYTRNAVLEIYERNSAAK